MTTTKDTPMSKSEGKQIAFQGEVCLGHWAARRETSKGATDASITLYSPDSEEVVGAFQGAETRGRSLKATGKRYYMVLVELDDDEMPVEQPKAVGPINRKKKASQEAWLMLHDQSKNFRRWVGYLTKGGMIATLQEADDFLKQECSIDSKSQLDTDERALIKFKGLTKAFRDWING